MEAPDGSFTSIAEGVVVVVIAISALLLVGLVWPGHLHPLLIAVIALATGIAWTYRPQVRQVRYFTLVILGFLVLAIPFAVSPTLIARLLP